jgi:hypothetical protein
MADGFIQDHFRVRSGDTVGLNADTGWAADENVNATIGTGVIFRIRFKVREIGSVEGATQFKLQCKFNAGSWTDVGISDDSGGVAKCVECMPSSQFSDAAVTDTMLLTSHFGQGFTWEDGEGVAAAQVTGNILTGSYTLNQEETEYEYCIRILTFFYDPQSSFDQVQAGDTIEFRMVESTGTVFPNAYTNPVITVAESAGFVGATSIEARARVAHLDSNDNLYILCEDNGRSGTAQRLVVKSTDRGAIWRVMDDANRPAEDDWESGDMQVIGTECYMSSQLNNDVYHDTFRFSDDGSNPDTWGTTDEAIRTGVTRDNQYTTMVRRSDGTMVAFWQELNTDYRMRYSIKDPTWSAPIDLDADAGKDQYQAFAVLGENDLTHIFYTNITDGYLYHKSLSSSDVLSDRELVHDDVGTGGSEEHPILSAIYYDASGTERIVVAFRDDSDSLIYTSKIDNDGSPSAPVVASDNTVKNNGIGGSCVVGQLINDGSDLYIIYGDDTNGYIWITKSVNYGSWDTDDSILTDVDADACNAFFYEPSDNSKQIGILFEDNSNAANGFLEFYEHEIQAATGGLPDGGSARGVMRGASRGT